MKRILLISVILVAILLSACAKNTDYPISVGYTIRVTGSEVILDKSLTVSDWLGIMKKYPNSTSDLWKIEPAAIRFSGSYMVIESNGSSYSRSVDDYSPVEYNVTGNIVSCTFQKSSEDGILTVEILKEGSVINSSSTSAEYGVISVTN